MAKSRPLYTVQQQFDLLDTTLPHQYNTINILKFRLLVACSDSGTLDQAKNKFLFLIQNTVLKNLFASLLEVPEIPETIGVSSVQGVHNKFKQHYGLIHYALSELRKLRVPSYTIDTLESYFFGNDDPVYKLSAIASIILMAYIKDDELNNRKE